MVLVGIILLSGMAAGGVHIWRKRRKDEEQNSLAQASQNAESENPDL